MEKLRKVEGEHDEGEHDHGHAQQIRRKRQDHAVGDRVLERRFHFPVPLRVGVVRVRLHWPSRLVEGDDQLARRHRAQLLTRSALLGDASRGATAWLGDCSVRHHARTG
eukprot:1643860-Pleurochrysis_carterae.AAC.1